MLSKSNFRLFSTTTGAPTVANNTVEPVASCCNCTCGCHSNTKKTTKNTKNSLTPPRRWLERICRRPSLSSSSISCADEQQPPRSPTTEERTKSLLRDFEQLYETVKEELAYATESQGSIYYEDDLLTAKRVLGDWLDCYDELVQIMKGPELFALHVEWETSRNYIYDQLKKLPLP
ncbi:hypothetical protein BDC45DRAFT_605234 [Circinella umbellata]|nr:hypothetical protein BDC45DRAFT_605234 [Circinella umbellata]